MYLQSVLAGVIKYSDFTQLTSVQKGRETVSTETRLNDCFLPMS